MSDETVLAALTAARAAQAGWSAVPVAARVSVVGAVRKLLVREMRAILGCMEWGRSDEDTLAAELLPTLEAARFLERQAARILAPRTPAGRRPIWLAGVRAEIRREPLGVVLVLAPGNYPLFLPAVQVLQALVAGNGVCVKPAPGRGAPMHVLAGLLREAGLPDGLLHVLDASHAAGEAAARAGFDKLFFTGSARTGERVLAAAAPGLTPSVMELSGNDPVFVLPGADLPVIADSLAYGLRLNRGATCIAPRRVFVTAAEAPVLERLLAERLGVGGPVPLDPGTAARVEEALGTEGVRLSARPEPGSGPVVLAGGGVRLGAVTDDLFAPVMSLLSVPDMETALVQAAASRYALGASIFGPEPEALAFAGRVRAGSVTVNDLIVPTADPRLPFGGRGRSGFGVTRGAEGLLEMTAVKTVSVRTGRFRPHLASPGSAAASVPMASFIEALHGSGGGRLRALGRLVAHAGWR